MPQVSGGVGQDAHVMRSGTRDRSKPGAFSPQACRRVCGWLGMLVLIAAGCEYCARAVWQSRQDFRLIQAVRACNAPAVRDLLESGADPDSVEPTDSAGFPGELLALAGR